MTTNEEIFSTGESMKPEIGEIRADVEAIWHKPNLTKGDTVLLLKHFQSLLSALDESQKALANLRAEVIDEVVAIVSGGFPADAHVYTAQVIAELEAMKGEPNGK
jgi:hypothetical protein